MHAWTPQARTPYKSRSRRAVRTSRCFQRRLLSTIKDSDTHKFRYTCVILWLTVICHMQHPDLRLCVAQRITYRRRWYAWRPTKQVIVLKLVSRRKDWGLCCREKNVVKRRKVALFSFWQFWSLLYSGRCLQYTSTPFDRLNTGMLLSDVYFCSFNIFLTGT